MSVKIPILQTEIRCISTHSIPRNYLLSFSLYITVHPGLHAQYHPPAFGPMQSLARSQSVATSAAAAAAAQVAAAAAAGVNPLQIMDHPRFIFQPSPAALGVGGMCGVVNVVMHYDHYKVEVLCEKSCDQWN